MLENIITFIGAGNIGSCLINGMIKSGFNPQHIWATNPKQKHLTDLYQTYGIHTSTDNNIGVNNANIVVLTVKPQTIKSVALEITATVKKKQPLIITIAAGVPESKLRQWLGDNTAIIACMPNVAAAVNLSASVLFANPQVTTEQKQSAATIFNSVGTTIWIDDEKYMPIATALSGSGPAYFFLLLETLEDAAIQLGLPATIAKTLALQTALGSAHMATEMHKTVSELRQQVTSPGGVTEQGIKSLEKNHFQQIILAALAAAKNRYQELTKMLDK